MNAKKNRVLYVKRFLEEQTDEAHQATLADTINYLAGEGIAANRRTVAQDIEQVTESGVDIICNKSRQNQYFVGERPFEMPELKLLFDAVQASKFLTAKRSERLVDKLLSVSSFYQGLDLTDGVYYDYDMKPKNENAYITTDVLFAAIRTKKRVQFMYIEYQADKKRHTSTIVRFMSSALGSLSGITTATTSLDIQRTTARWSSSE